MKKRSVDSIKSNRRLSRKHELFTDEASSSFEPPKPISDNELLFEAVKSGKDVLVRHLISQGVPATIRDKFGGHPLYYAARYGHENVVKLLLTDSKNLIDRPTKMLRTPLQIASFHGHSNIVRFFVENKAKVNLTDSLGMSALHWAAENNHAETVRILLKAGANRALINTFGKTALCLAEARDNYAVCEILQDLDKLSSDLLNGSNDEKLRARLSSKEQTQENETIKLFEQHGIKLLPVDDSTIIANALKRGQTAVLTEAGKLALKKTQPAFLRSISNMTNHASKNFAQISPPKKMRVDKTNTNNTAEKKNVPKSSEKETNSCKMKVLKVDSKQLIHKSASPSTVSSPKSTSAMVIGQDLNSMSSKADISTKCVSENTNTTKSLELELQKKVILIEHMKKQLEISMRLTKHYKTKYESKEKEAELYRSQLVNLSEMLTSSGYEVLNLNRSFNSNPI